ncbi:4-hydroxy-tetrahydrodipicolinate reductase, partial [Alphaproteobacteria bacterium]|nr:4-hydroxy-tetrahydrodipicolinate reductase [Alphaproteobacteria bacterium]
MKKISVSIPGGNGRMGKTLIRLIIENEKYDLASSTCLPGEDEEGLDVGLLAGKSKIFKELTCNTQLLFKNSDVLIDFTIPEAAILHAKKCYENNMPIVIGTTGLDVSQENELLSLSKKIPIVYSANFSIGITLLSNLASDSTKILGEEWDIEILEMHHRHKVDAPSGTALMLGKSVATARDQLLSDVKAVSRDGIVGKRKSEEIGFAVLRGGDVVGEHSVLFCNEGE